jgi:hypothetical protein
MFWFNKIIVHRDIGQFQSDLDYTTRMLLHTVHIDSNKSQPPLRVGFFAGCANHNRPVPRQQISTLTYWFVCIVGGRTKFLSSHKSQLSHIGLDPLD